MVRGLYTAGSGMMYQQHRMAVIANNLANTSTVGYKRDIACARARPERLIFRVPGKQHTGSLGTRVIVDDISVDTATASLKMTGRPTDLAISGPGYFIVDTPGGPRFTRAGNFCLNNRGELVTEDGYHVRGDSGVLATGTTQMRVSNDGSVVAGGEMLGRILVAEIPGRYLVKQGDSLFRLLPGGQATIMEQHRVRLNQGYLEESNVNPVREMVGLIEVNRAYEANQRVIRMVDDSLEKLIAQAGNA